MGASILGIEYHLPDRVETNEDLKRENPDWLIEKLYSKSGIASRRIAGPGETASDLGFHAARKLLDNCPVPPTEIDFLLYCTQSPDRFLPSDSCVLQHRLGLPKSVGAFDFNLGCSGYIYGLYAARAFIDAGMARHVLLVTADTYTRYIHPRDRTVRTLFGDGAAATLIGPSDGRGSLDEFILGTDGAGAENLIVPAGGLRLPHSPQTGQEHTDASACTRSADNLFMDGRAIFDFAIATVPPLVADLLAKARLTPADIDWYVYHQANKFMLQALAQRSDIPSDKMVFSMADIGNTISASIPIAVKRYAEAGKIRPGQRLMLVGFGVGYSWGTCLVRWA